MYNDYYLTDAVALLPRYDEFGKLYTVMVKKTELQRAPFHPTRIIDDQLRRNGSSLRGAKDAACYINGTTYMHPFLMQTYPELHVWFPTESPRNETCVYLCLHQIVKYGAYLESETETIVYLYGRFAIVIPLSKSKFESRIKEARYFHSKMSNQRNFTYELTRAEDKQILYCAEMHEKYIVD